MAIQSEDIFYAKYHPEFNQVLLRTKAKGINPEDIAPYGGCMYETYGEELARVKEVAKENPKRIWTVIDGDSGDLTIVAGFHFINRLGYLITEEEYENIEEEYAD